MKGLLWLLPILAITPLSSKPLPAGFYELESNNDTIQDISKFNAWTRPDVTGVAIRVYWSAIQPTSVAQYDWRYLDAVASAAQQYGKQFSINVAGGFNAPAWVYQAGPDGPGSSTFRISGTKHSGTMPAPWDVNFQRRWGTFLAVLGARYDALPNLSYVIVTGQGWGGQASLCQSQADNNELAAAGGVNVWVNAYVSIVRLYVKAFSQTPLIVNIGAPVYPQVLDGFKTANATCLSKYGNQYGIKDNALNPKSGTTGWQATEIKTLSATHPVGFQQLAPSTTQTDFTASIEIGESLGSKLFEAYPTDLTLVSDVTSL